jgi:hypothetical protein
MWGYSHNNKPPRMPKCEEQMRRSQIGLRPLTFETCAASSALQTSTDDLLKTLQSSPAPLTTSLKRTLLGHGALPRTKPSRPLRRVSHAAQFSLCGNLIAPHASRSMPPGMEGYLSPEIWGRVSGRFSVGGWYGAAGFGRRICNK